jgi:hypothetical protein
LRSTLLAGCAFAACVTVWSNAVAQEAGPGGDSDLVGRQFKILSSDGKQTIGSTSFTVLHHHSTEEIKGETRYLNGDRDSEDIRLHLTGAASTPSLETYQHSFFNADGSPLMLDTLDAKSGDASCTSYWSGTMKVRKSRLEVPADSFAGASSLMMVGESLRRGIRQIKFHAFACVPGPEIFGVDTSAPARPEHWPLYPGDLIRLDMRPDLGALNLLIAPFMPMMDAWFNPADDWNYVGGEFDRYFRGPHVLTVQVLPAK